jgi:curved DNA-binding protein CbpA
MTSEQAFEILGIKDRNITEASLKKAFYSAARKTHPDSNPDDEAAQENFNRIREAYDVLCLYLEYENKRKREAKQSRRGAKIVGTGRSATSGARRQGSSGTSASEARRSAYTTARRSGAARARQNRAAENDRDVWENYSEADLKYARKRHADASERAKETIRNHANRERERAAREKRAKRAVQQARHAEEVQEKREREAAERRAWEEQEARRRAKQEQELNDRVQQFGKVSDDEVKQFWAVFRTMCSDFKKLWNRFITRNYRLKRLVLFLLFATLVAWAGTVMLGTIGSVAKLTRYFAIAAKWILIVWVSLWVSSIVRKNWNNRLWSAFGFMIAMELAIFVMNWLSEVVEKIRL